MRTPLLLSTALLAVVAAAPPSSASHSWGKYHWAQSGSTEVTVQLGDNLTDAWDTLLPVVTSASNAATVGWDDSPVLATPIVGGAGNANCGPVAGRVEVCNGAYGETGWLGIASIWTSRGHIVQGTAKQNDTYFNQPPYNTTEWRQYVLCQEVGHTFGLDHVDETFDNANLGTCMDYTSDPSGGVGGLANTAPNQHDLEQLAAIYNGHHATKGGGRPAKASSTSDTAVGNDASSWGTLIRGTPREGTSLYARQLAGDAQIFTFVIWAR